MLTFSLLGCGSPLYSTAMTFCKSRILLLILCWLISLRTPSCQVVNALSWVLFALLSFMLAPLTFRFSHIARACLMSSHAEPFYISFAAWFPIFTRGDFPPSVAILHMCPCIEHRYVLLLGTSFLVPWASSPPRFVTIKHFYSFSSFSKYLKKSKKFKKPKNQKKKICYHWQQLSRVSFKQRSVYHIRSLGY